LSGDAYTRVPDDEQERVIDRAIALGITLFETADSYAHGVIEARLGVRVPVGSSQIIVTKIGTDRVTSPPRKRFDAQSLRNAVSASQERLRRIPDVVLLHNPSERALEKREATDTLSELKNAGQLRAWGVSAGNAAVALKALELGADVISVTHNVFHEQDLAALKEQLHAKKVGILAHSVLAYGLLCGQWPTSKEFPTGDHRAERWSSDELKRRISQLNALRPAVFGPVTSLRAAALRFALASQDVSSVILGPRTTLQLDQLVREAGKEPPYLSDEALIALRNRLQTVGVIP
jgi:aryl-alcohol dehydrogenase-like predicted oxidoreductase